MARSGAFFSGVGLRVALGAVIAGACASEPVSSEAELGTQRSAIELHDRGGVYGFAFEPPPPLAPGETLDRLRDRLERMSFPVQATGAILMPFRNAQGDPTYLGDIAVRGTCGVTLVSPSYAVSAGHCLATHTVARPERDLVTLQMSRTTPRLASEDVWRPKLEVSGSFPEYEHERFDESDGYFVDDYLCQLVSNCSTGFNCPGGVGSSDLALLSCAGRPGDRYGYLDVAEVDTPDSEVFISWRHEVLDFPRTNDPTSDVYKHYVKYPSVRADNYHYLDRSQLLPLMSIPWPDGTPHKKLGTGSTDALGCHGTSGTGFLQRNGASGAWELLGPTTVGDRNLSRNLCHHLPALDGEPPLLPGEAHIGYGSLARTRAMLAAFPAHRAECAAQPEGLFTLGGRDGCYRAQSGLALVPRAGYADFDPWRGPVLTLAAGERVTAGSVRLEQGRRYRLAVGGVPDRGCDVESECPELGVWVGEQQVLRTRVQASPGQVALAGASFVADASGEHVVRIAATGAAFELGELSIVRNARVNGFDTAYERAEAALVVPELDARAALPMRFSGDGKQGFMALLHAGERLVLARAAVARQGSYSFSFASSRPEPLRCGLVARDGSVLVSTTCRAGETAQLDWQGQPAAAAFIDGAGTEPADLDDVQIVLAADGPSRPCEDGLHNGDESDLDCGGSCPSCGNGQSCLADADCVSSFCLGGRCACRPESCGEQGLECGSSSDGCGSMIDCGSCSAPELCGANGVPNMCSCPAESDAAFCARNGKNCGSVTATDNCGVTRTVASCGTCRSPLTCGGGGATNVCGCTPESDAAFCARRGKNCGTVWGTDNCGSYREVSSCGTCTAPATCGGDGRTNVCGEDGPACFRTAYRQDDCLTYIQGVTVSFNRRNYLCSNGNCANCAGFASCAPGGSGCPWGVVWTDLGACRPR
jgi:hypothetical protein